MKKITFFISILFLLTFYQAYADDFLQIIQKAFRNSPTWQQKLSKLDYDSYEASKVSSIWKPKVTFTTAYTKGTTFNVFIPEGVNKVQDQGVKDLIRYLYTNNDSPSLQAKLVLQQYIFAGGRIPISFSVQEQVNRALYYKRQAEEQLFIITIAQAYSNVLLTQRKVIISNQVVKRLEKELQIASIKKNYGVIPKTDLDLTNAQLSGEKAKLIDNEDKYQTALLKYINLTGSPATKTMSLDDLNLKFTKFSNYVDLLNQSTATNPSLLAAQYNERFTENMVSYTRGNLLPTLGLQLQTQYGGPLIYSKSYGFGIGLSLEIPLYNSGINWIEYNKSKVKNREAAAKLVEVINTIQTNSQIYFKQMQAASNKLQSYKFVENANYEAFLQAQVSYQQGLINITDLLLWQERWYQSQLNSVQSKADFYLSRFALASIDGELVYKKLFGKDEIAERSNLSSSAMY